MILIDNEASIIMTVGITEKMIISDEIVMIMIWNCHIKMVVDSKVTSPGSREIITTSMTDQTPEVIYGEMAMSIILTK